MKFAHVAIAASLLMASGSGIAHGQIYTTGLENKSMGDVEKSAKAGDSTAEWELGRRYYYDPKHKDDAKARDWFGQAAAQGEPWAEYELATMLENGEGGPADSTGAFGWYQKAQAGGIARADCDLAVMYLSGDGVAQNNAQAITWTKLGVDANDARSEALMGQFMLQGQLVPQDTDKGIALLKAAVKQREPMGAKILEAAYRDGTGVAKDPITAHAWRTMAGYLGNLGKEDVPAGAKASYYILYTTVLDADDNFAAWKMYKGFMIELGFAIDDAKPGPNGSTPDSAAQAYIREAEAKAGS